MRSRNPDSHKTQSICVLFEFERVSTAKQAGRAGTNLSEERKERRRWLKHHDTKGITTDGIGGLGNGILRSTTTTTTTEKKESDCRSSSHGTERAANAG